MKLSNMGLTSVLSGRVRVPGWPYRNRGQWHALTYRRNDRLSDVDQGAEIDNKRLGHILALSRQVQTERDNRRISGSPSRTNQGEPVRPEMRANNTRKQRELKQIDPNAMILRTCEMQAAAVGKLPSTERVLNPKPDNST
jgi:hypothetical protein